MPCAKEATLWKLVSKVLGLIRLAFESPVAMKLALRTAMREGSPTVGAGVVSKVPGLICQIYWRPAQDMLLGLGLAMSRRWPGDTAGALDPADVILLGPKGRSPRS